MIEYVFHFSTPSHNLLPAVREVIGTVNGFMAEIDPHGPELTTPMTEVFTATCGPFHEPLPPEKLAELSNLLAARAALIDDIPFTLTNTTTRTVTCKPTPGSTPGSSPALPPATPPTSGATSPSSGNPPSPPLGSSSSASSPSAG